MTTITVLNPAKLSADVTANMSSLSAVRAQQTAVRAENRRYVRAEAKRRREEVMRIKLNARGKFVFGSFGVILLLCITLLGATLFSAKASADSDSHSGVNTFGYVVPMPGDSMWDIAVQLDPKSDPRDLMAEIKNLNQLKSYSVDAYKPLAVPKRMSGKPGVMTARDAGVVK